MSNEASKRAAKLAVAPLGSLQQASGPLRAKTYREIVEAIRYELEGNNTRQTEESIEIFIDALVEIIRGLNYISDDEVYSRDGFGSHLKQAKIKLESAFDKAQKKGPVFYRLVNEAADYLTNSLTSL